METSDSQTETGDSPWYAEGLRFSCTQCGRCCGGAPGFVWVDESELDRLSESMDMDRSTFDRQFTRRVGNRVSLVEYPDGDCIFLDPDSRGCLVYDSRPIQCRTWPFWDTNLASPADWSATCEECPGAGKGTLYPLEEINIRASEKSV